MPGASASTSITAHSTHWTTSLKEQRRFIIPRSSTTIREPPAWKKLIGRLIDSPMEFLSEYYRRENSESQFSADKRTNGTEDTAEKRGQDQDCCHVQGHMA